MVNHKKTKRKGGRKHSSGSTSYSKLSPTSQLLYHRLGTAKYRGQPHDDPTADGAPQPVHSGEGSTTSSLTVSRGDKSSRQGTRCGAGRPPLDPDAGPMSPGALAARKRRLGHEKYKRKKISLIRRKANLMRLDRQGCGDGDNVSRESIGEHVEELEDEEELEEEENEEV